MRSSTKTRPMNDNFIKIVEKMNSNFYYLGLHHSLFERIILRHRRRYPLHGFQR